MIFAKEKLFFVSQKVEKNGKKINNNFLHIIKNYFKNPKEFLTPGHGQVMKEYDQQDTCQNTGQTNLTRRTFFKVRYIKLTF